jgi:hypothetical protein
MFFAGRRNSWIERGPDGHLREARHAPVEPQASERETEKRRDREVVIEVDREHARLERDPEVAHLRQNLPSFQQVERLLDLYVATGEGRGAYVKARKQVEEERRHQLFEQNTGDFDDFDDFDLYDGPRLRRRMRPSGFGPSVPRRRSSESPHSSDDDPYRGGERIPEKPPGGGPSAGPGPALELNIEHLPPRRRGPLPGPSRRVTIVTPTTGQEIIDGENPNDLHPHVTYDEIQVAEAHERYAPPRSYLRMPTEYRRSRGYRHPTVRDVSSDEDDLDLASLPSEEDDVRLRPRSRNVVQRNERIEVGRMQSIERERDERRERPIRRTELRGGGAPDDSITSRTSRRLGLRGGGPVMRPPTKTSAVAADVLEDYDIRSKAIV